MMLSEDVDMACFIPDCLGNYNFDNIAQFAQKRFVEGYNTIDLMTKAGTYREKEEIALVALLSLNANQATDLELDCKYAGKCKVSNCRELIAKMINENLKMDLIPLS
jgi:hypothetical protein